MGWKDNLLDASFRGVRFDVLGTKDQIDNATAEHEYAYVNGANIEDLGEKAMFNSLRAVFYGDDYELRLEEFLTAFRVSGAGELVHPVFGRRMVQRQSFSIEHQAELVDGCFVNLSFKESRPEQPLFSYKVVSSAADAAAGGAQQIGDIASSFFSFEVPRLANLLPGLAAVNAFVNKLNGRITSLINQVGFEARSLVSLGQTIVNMPAAWVSDLRSMYQSVMQPLNGLLGLTDSGTASSATATTAATTATTAASSAVAITAATNTSAAAGGGKMATWKVAIGIINTALTRAQTETAINPNPAAQEVIVLGAAFGAAIELSLAAAVVVDAAAALLADEVVNSPELSPIELEAVATDTRTLVQTAIEAVSVYYAMTPDPASARPLLEPLRESAYQIQEAAATAINLRPPLLLRPAPHAGSLALIAHTWYSDWQRCAELARLNPQVRQPNFILANQLLSAYAD